MIIKNNRYGVEVIKFNLWRSFHNEYALLDVVYFTRSIKSNHYGVKVIRFNLWRSFHNEYALLDTIVYFTRSDFTNGLLWSIILYSPLVILSNYFIQWLIQLFYPNKTYTQIVIVYLFDLSLKIADQGFNAASPLVVTTFLKSHLLSLSLSLSLSLNYYTNHKIVIFTSCKILYVSRIGLFCCVYYSC